MKIDLYTKFVLTVIALALVGMLFKPIFVSKGANASDGYVQVTGTVNVNVTEVGGKAVRHDYMFGQKHSYMDPALPVEVVK